MEEESVAATGRALKTILQNKFKSTKFSVRTNRIGNTIQIEWADNPTRELVEYYIQQIENCDKTRPVYIEIKGKTYKGKVPEIITTKRIITENNIKKALMEFEEKSEEEIDPNEMTEEEITEIFRRYEQEKDNWTEEERQEKEKQKKELIERYDKEKYAKDKRKEICWIKTLLDYMESEYPLDEKETHVEIAKTQANKNHPGEKGTIKMSLRAAHQTVTAIDKRTDKSRILQIEEPEIHYKVMGKSGNIILEGNYYCGKGNYGIIGDLLFYRKGEYIPQDCIEEIKSLCTKEENYEEMEEKGKPVTSEQAEKVKISKNPKGIETCCPDILTVNKPDRRQMIRIIAKLRMEQIWPRKVYEQVKNTDIYKKAYITSVINNAYAEYHKTKRRKS